METGFFRRCGAMIGNFVCFLEGKSEKEMLRIIIPKLTHINKENIKYILFDGKVDLQKNIHEKIHGYRIPNSVFLVMCDKDTDDCKELKEELVSKIAKDRVKAERTKIRIACSELESFYLGDLQAVEKGIKCPNLSKKQNKTTYRSPDNSPKPSKLLEYITEGKYQKTAGSRKIAQYLKLDGNNKSKSFNMLLKAIEELYETLSRSATA